MRHLLLLPLIVLSLAALAAGAGGPIDEPEMLPDSIRVEGSGAVRAAWLVYPTQRYAHAILGDGIEAQGIRVELNDGRRITYRLPEDSVFEDRFPRLLDIDGDGVEEMVLVRSYLERGAALVVLKIERGAIRILAESRSIGLPHRWLNPVGAADFDSDGEMELAAVVTPHIGGTLTLYRIRGQRLLVSHRLSGFSNHRIGSRNLGQSAVLDVNGDGRPEMAIPSADFRQLRLVGLQEGELREVMSISHNSPIDSALQLIDLDGNGYLDLRYALADGETVELLFPQSVYKP